MTKTTSLLLVLAFFLMSWKLSTTHTTAIPTSTTSETIVTAWDEFGLKGKVKSMIIKNHTAENSNGKWKSLPSTSSSFLQEVNFDETGKTLNQIVSFEGKRLWKSEFKYRDERLTEILRFNSRGELDQQAKVITSTPYIKREEIKTFDKAGNLVNTTKLKWEADRIVRKTDFSEKDRAKVIETYRFNENREESAVLMRKKEGLAPEIYQYKNEYLDFDTNGNWIKRGEQKTDSYDNIFYTIKERIIQYY